MRTHVGTHGSCVRSVFQWQLASRQVDKVIVPRCADARAVRPYIPVMAILMRKMIEMASYANACRDARSVRPLAFQLTVDE